MNNQIHRTVRGLIRGALILGAGMGSVLAQDAADAANELEEVHVTGSRIQRDGMSTPTPVTVVNMDDLKVLAPTTIGAAVTQLPQFNNSSVPEGAAAGGWTGASGASILNLRGVGQNRTLVLLDGRRVVPSSRRGTLDVNLLPDPLIQRVEVVTGGASAAWGSDAVSGVVNFMLDTKLEGFAIDLQGGLTEIGDNENLSASLSGGLPLGDRAHLIAAVDIYKVKAIKDAFSRDWQDSWGIITNTAAAIAAGGPARIKRSDVRSRQYTEGGLITTGPFANRVFNPDGTLSPFVAGTDVTATTQVGGSGVDPSFYNYATPDNTRGSAFAYLSYDLTDTTTAFLQTLYGRNDSAYLSPPAGAQYGSWYYTIYGDNAFLPTAVASTMTAAQNFRLGRSGDLDYGAGKEIEQQNELQSVTTGLKMGLGDWRLDAYYQYGRTNSDIYMDNAIRLDRVYQAVDAVRSGGQVVCRSTLTYANNGCVPMNVFGVGAPSQAAIDWISQDVSQKQVVEQHVADVSLSGVAFNNWAGEVSVATGVSWRKESFDQSVYPVELHELDMPVANAALGYKGLPAVYAGSANIFERGPSTSVDGSYDVKEVFGEMQMPLLGETALSRSVEFNAAVRYAEYEGSGGVWAWKGGIDWQVTDEVRLRATRSRDVRAGSLSERFDSSRGPGTIDDLALRDPVTGIIPRYEISVIAGGNPEVDPEEADTLTFGVIYRPSWFEGFAISADAFDIKIDGAIGQLGAQEIVRQCVAGATQLCDYIQRGADGRVSLMYNLFINTAESRTRGIDLESSYRTPVSFFGGNESLSLRVLASYIDELSTRQVGAAKTDRAGQTGVAGGAPDWQGTVSLGYTRGAFSTTLQERFINAGLLDNTWVQGVDVDDNTINAAWVTNLQLGWDGAGWGESTYRVSLNVNNLFDSSPPIVGSFAFTGSQSTNTSLFDIYGRRYSLGVNFKF